MSFLLNPYIVHFGGGGEPSGSWLTVVTGMSTAAQLLGLDVLDSDSIICSGVNNYVSATSGDIFAIAFNKVTGSVEWQKTAAAVLVERSFAACVDTNSKIRLLGSQYVSGSYQNLASLMLNADGTFNNETYSTYSGGTTEVYSAIARPSGEIFGFGQYGTGVFRAGVFKFSSANALTASYYITNMHSLWAAAEGNLSILATGYSNTSPYHITTMKMADNFSSVTWSRRLAAAGGFHSYGRAVGVDSSGNVYIAGDVIASPAYGLIAKYDTNGTLLWQKKLYHASNSVYARSLVCIADGVLVQLMDSISGALIHVHILSDGTLDWHSALIHSSNKMSMLGRAVLDTSTDKLFVCGLLTIGGSNTGVYAAQLPQTQPTAGTYGDVVIANGTYSYADAGATGSTQTLTLTSSLAATSTETATLTTQSFSSVVNNL